MKEVVLLGIRPAQMETPNRFSPTGRYFADGETVLLRYLPVKRGL